MAHEIMANDGLILAGKPAWHGLGTVVALAGLDWALLQVKHLQQGVWVPVLIEDTLIQQ